MSPRPGFTPDGDLDVAAERRPGAVTTGDGVRFEVWAPTVDAVDVVIDPDGERRAVPMARADGPVDDGIWEAVVAGIGHGTRYRYRLGGTELADPASRHQPEGVFGPSAVVDPTALRWTDGGWAGVELDDTVLYELHVGTFTPQGTLDAAAAHLPRLARLGVTTIELMPLAQFSGRRGWGYDGVFLSAVQHSYGGPAALARFVDAAHGLGLAVVLDVVYNHFGPEGNVANRFGPYLTDTFRTPWGAAVNVAEAGSDQVRRFFVDNARLWVEDYHVDGLRIDAVHAIVDPTSRPFLEELTAAVHDIGRRRQRTVLTFLESADNDPRTVTPPPSGLGGDAVWNDDYHHALRVAVTGDRAGYYADYRGPADVADVLRHNWSFRGRYSEVRGRRHGRDASHVDPSRFVVFGQNHDQVGNRRDGERLGLLVEIERRKLVLAAVLLSPFTPLLFMGEEYGDPAPFPFFVDHQDPELLDAVRRGRAGEFASFAWTGPPPDPGSIDTFRSAVLRPELAARRPHSQLLALTARLLALRRRLQAAAEARPVVDQHGTVVSLERPGRPSSLVALQFGPEPVDVTPWRGSVVLDTADVAWGGPGAGEVGRDGSLTMSPWSAVVAVDDG